MKALLICDMEGCIDISSAKTENDKKHVMQKEISIIINHLHQELSDIEITVLDFHNLGLNLCDIEEHFKDVKFIHQFWNFDFYASYDFALLIGMHSANGKSGKYAHTFRCEIKNMFLNNENVGETELLIDWLLNKKIPVKMINGDYGYCNSINLFPEIKRSVSTTYECLLNDINVALSDKSLCNICGSGKVRMELTYPEMVYFFPPDYDKDAYNIYFDSTNDFFYTLGEICIVLNYIDNLYAYRGRLLTKKIYHYVDLYGEQVLKDNIIKDLSNKIYVSREKERAITHHLNEKWGDINND